MSTKVIPQVAGQRNHKVAICLSGGGYRATLFHLGVLGHLSAKGLLAYVDRVYGVSGGSILAAHFAANRDLYLNDFRLAARSVVELVTETDLRTPVLRFLRRKSVAQSLKSFYTITTEGQGRRCATLGDAEVDVYLLGTDYRTGRSVEFSKYEIRTWPNSHLHRGPLAPGTNYSAPMRSAVAASAAFSPFLPPVVLDESFTGQEKDPTRNALGDLYLMEVGDGGLRDNVAIEAFLRHELSKDEWSVLVSDAGLQVRADTDARRFHTISGMINRMRRAVDIFMQRIGILDGQRLDVSGYTYKVLSIGDIGAGDRVLSTAMALTASTAPTDLCKFPINLAYAIAQHGHDVARSQEVAELWRDRREAGNGEMDIRQLFPQGGAPVTEQEVEASAASIKLGELEKLLLLPRFWQGALACGVAMTVLCIALCVALWFKGGDPRVAAARIDTEIGQRLLRVENGLRRLPTDGEAAKDVYASALGLADEAVDGEFSNRDLASLLHELHGLVCSDDAKEIEGAETAASLLVEHRRQVDEMTPEAFLESMPETTKWQVSILPRFLLSRWGLVTTTPHGMTLRHLPSGHFISADGSSVQVEREFYISCYETTRAQFRSYAEAVQFSAEGRGFKIGIADGIPKFEVVESDSETSYSWDKVGLYQNDQLPVGNISWGDAIAFCNWLTGEERLAPYYEPSGVAGVWKENPKSNGYRLPTEAEWEYACRAGSRGEYSFGDRREFGRFGNCGDLAYCSAFGSPKARVKSVDGINDNEVLASRVGTFNANGWGLYDMHGNTQEWCWDLWDESQLFSNKPGNEQESHVMRSGNWTDLPEDCSSTARNGYKLSQKRHPAQGFRVVRNVPTP